jgi:DNA-binding GntR family transcriptional regulator
MRLEPSSHADEIVRRIQQEILQGRMAPGTKLDELALAEQFGVSRTPVREALHRLSASGVLTLRGRQGVHVTQLSVAELLDAYFVVANLEGLAANVAARRISDSERGRLRESHTVCAARAEAGDGDGFYAANIVFHDIIIEACHNRLLQEQLVTTRLLIAPYRYHVTFQHGRMTSSITQHAEVMDAILRGDGEAAQALMTNHVNLLGENLADVLYSIEAKTGRRAN